jgi:hypothetical protein
VTTAQDDRRGRARRLDVRDDVLGVQGTDKASDNATYDPTFRGSRAIK